MTQSTDINTLLDGFSYDTLHSVDKKKAALLSTVKKIAEATVSEKNSGWILTNGNIQSGADFFCIQCDSNTMLVLETSHTTKHVFQFNFDTGFITYNSCRAHDQDILLFSRRLQAIAATLTKGHLFQFFRPAPTAQPSGLNTEKIILNHLNTNPHIQHAMDYGAQRPSKDRIIHTTQALLKLSRQLAEYIKLTSQENEEDLATKYEARFKLISLLDDTHATLFISNQSKQHSNLNMLFSLTVTRNATIYEEHYSDHHTKVEFTHADLAMTLNEKPMSGPAITWFLKRLEKIGADLEQGQLDAGFLAND